MGTGGPISTLFCGVVSKLLLFVYVLGGCLANLEDLSGSLELLKK
jgi:hypothetical protein